MKTLWQKLIVRSVQVLNCVLCRVVYRVRPISPPPLPPTGSALLVCDHTSLSDGFVLFATGGRLITFVIARKVYERPHLRWVFQAFDCIPVSRGTTDVGAVRAMVTALDEGKVLGMFPEGGIDEYRDERGHLGVGYLALKTGAPVIPASIIWDKTRPKNLLRALLTPGQAVVRYGTPIQLGFDSDPDREKICEATEQVMRTIRELRVRTP